MAVILFISYNVSIEQFNNRFFPYLRLLTGSEFLYLSYIANLGKSRISKKIENLIETFLIRLIPCITMVNNAFKLLNILITIFSNICSAI